MTLIDLGERAIYRYRVNVDFYSKIPLEHVQNWVQEHDIQCALVPGVAFFHSEKDAIMFILRWS
jgi:hypothetical protein